MTSERERIRSQALEIARGWSGPDAPVSWGLTAALFEELGQDDVALEAAAAIPPERMPALLMIAATVDVVAEVPDCDLGRYFPRGATSGATIDDAFGPILRTFWGTHRDEIALRCAARRYQMNEVGRSSGIALALSVVGRLTGDHGWTLIDLGTAAGFGLHVDRYRYELSDGRVFGDPRSNVVLRCEVESPGVPWAPDLPRIDRRIGVELDPIDLSEPAARRWLRACIPPEPESLARFDAALTVVQTHPTEIHQGDALRLLPELLDALPTGAPVVITDSYAAVFFSDADRNALREVLEHEASRRDIAWISLDPLVPLGTEGRDSVQGLDVPDLLVRRYQEDGVFGLLGLILYQSGRPRRWMLGTAHPSGTRLTWLDPPVESRSS